MAPVAFIGADSEDGTITRTTTLTRGENGHLEVAATVANGSEVAVNVGGENRYAKMDTLRALERGHANLERSFSRGNTYGDVAHSKEEAVTGTAGASLKVDGQEMNFWCPAKTFETFGVGFTLYFQQMASLTWLMSFVLFFAYCSVAILICAALLPSTSQFDDAMTNLQGIKKLMIPTIGTLIAAPPPPAPLFESIFKNGVDVRSVSLLVCCIDVFIVLVMLAIVTKLNWNFKKEVVKADADVCSISDYTLEVSGIPDDVTAEELRGHFSSCLDTKSEVHEVVVVKPCMHILSKHRIRTKAEIRLDKLIMRMRGAVAGRTLNTARVDRANAAVAAAAERNKKRACKAFVIFEHEKDAIKTLDAYPACVLWFLFRPKRLRVRNHRLRVRRAAEPSDVIWQNLEFGWLTRRARQALVSLILIILLAGTAAAVGYMKKNEPPREVNCLASEALGFLRCNNVFGLDFVGDYINAPLQNRTLVASYWQGIGAKNMLNECLDNERYIGDVDGNTVWRPQPKLGYITDGNITASAPYMPRADFLPYSVADSCAAAVCWQCYCSRAGFDDFVTNRYGHGDYCKDYWERFGETWMLRIGLVVVIITVNIIIQAILRKLTRFEKHQTVSHMEKNLSVKLFLTQFLNVALITLVIYAYFEELSPLYDWLNIETLKWAHDFTPQWYQQVGGALTIAIFANGIVKPFQPLVAYMLRSLYRRLKLWMRGKNLTKKEMDRLFRRPSFHLAERYGETLAMFFACLLFSAGMPFLYTVFWLYIIIRQMVDRKMLLRICKRPIPYDERMAAFFNSMIPWGLLLHCAFGFWMYSGELPSYMLSDELQDYVNDAYGNDIGIGDRFLTVNGFIMFVSFLLVFSVIAVQSFSQWQLIFFRALCGNCIRHLSSTQSLPGLSEAKQGELSGPSTYTPETCLDEANSIIEHDQTMMSTLYDRAGVGGEDVEGSMQHRSIRVEPRTNEGERGGGGGEEEDPHTPSAPPLPDGGGEGGGGGVQHTPIQEILRRQEENEWKPQVTVYP